MFGLQRLRGSRLEQLKYRVTHPVWMGTLRRKAPVTRWGWERGTPIDRFYIEAFLEASRADIRGRVLEVSDRAYTERFGSGVTASDVLDIEITNPRATVIADLAAADSIPSDSFDCFIITQTLQYLFDVRAAVSHSQRILRNGGVLLATVPVTSRIDNTIPDYWRFTASSSARLFERTFGAGNVKIETAGNCLSSIAFLSGLAAEDFRQEELELKDPNYPMLVCIRAQKVCER